MTQQLFTPVTLGDLQLANRIVMAPMTRNRAEADGTPNALMAEHYAQRASAGLIVAAGLFILWRERRLGIERANARKVMTPQG